MARFLDHTPDDTLPNNHRCKLSKLECILQHRMGFRKPQGRPAHQVARALRKLDGGTFGRRSATEKDVRY